MLKFLQPSFNKKELLNENAILATKVAQLKGIVANLEKELHHSRQNEEKIDKAKWALEIEHLQKINYWERKYQELENRHQELNSSCQSIKRRCEAFHILNTHIKHEANLQIKKNNSQHLLAFEKLEKRLRHESTTATQVLEKGYLKKIRELERQKNELQKRYETLQTLHDEVIKEQENAPSYSKQIKEMDKKIHTLSQECENYKKLLAQQQRTIDGEMKEEKKLLKMIYSQKISNLKAKYSELEAEYQDLWSKFSKKDDSEEVEDLKEEQMLEQDYPKQIKELNEKIQQLLQNSKRDKKLTKNEIAGEVRLLEVKYRQTISDLEAKNERLKIKYRKLMHEKEAGSELVRVVKKPSFVIVGKIDLESINDNRSKKARLKQELIEYEREKLKNNNSNRLNKKKYGTNELWRNNRKRCYPRRISINKSTGSAQKRNYRCYRLRCTRAGTILKPARQRLQCHCRSAKRQQNVGQSRCRRLDSGRNAF